LTSTANAVNPAVQPSEVEVINNVSAYEYRPDLISVHEFDGSTLIEEASDVTNQEANSSGTLVPAENADPSMMSLTEDKCPVKIYVYDHPTIKPSNKTMYELFKRDHIDDVDFKYDLHTSHMAARERLASVLIHKFLFAR
jgi:hypothetical protein